MSAEVVDASSNERVTWMATVRNEVRKGVTRCKPGGEAEEMAEEE